MICYDIIYYILYIIYYIVYSIYYIVYIIYYILYAIYYPEQSSPELEHAAIPLLGRQGEYLYSP